MDLEHSENGESRTSKMDEEKSTLTKKTCYGCIHNRPGQGDHMDIGGCLYEGD